MREPYECCFVKTDTVFSMNISERSVKEFNGKDCHGKNEKKGNFV